MPAPYWLAKYVATPLKKKMVTNGKWEVITHTGRVTGTAYRTPVSAIPVEGGFVIFVMYGSHKTDWVKNVLASGSATVTVGGETHGVADPTILDLDTARPMLPPGTDLPPPWAKVDEYLFLKTA